MVYDCTKRWKVIVKRILGKRELKEIDLSLQHLMSQAAVWRCSGWKSVPRQRPDSTRFAPLFMTNQAAFEVERKCSREYEKDWLAASNSSCEPASFRSPRRCLGSSTQINTALHSCLREKEKRRYTRLVLSLHSTVVTSPAWYNIDYRPQRAYCRTCIPWSPRQPLTLPASQ
jgi:hypothetical protein